MKPRGHPAVRLIITVLLAVVLLGIYAGAMTLFTASHMLPGDDAGKTVLASLVTTATSLVAFWLSIRLWTRTGGKPCRASMRAFWSALRERPVRLLSILIGAPAFALAIHGGGFYVVLIWDFFAFAFVPWEASEMVAFLLIGVIGFISVGVSLWLWGAGRKSYWELLVCLLSANLIWRFAFFLTMHW